MQFDITSCYIRPGFTDLRRGINGLIHTVITQMEHHPRGGELFLFCGRRRQSIKMLYNSGDGFWLLQKRLHAVSFPWPKSELEALQISEQEVSLLLQGIDLWRSHPILTAEKQLGKTG
jgi:transposase